MLTIDAMLDELKLRHELKNDAELGRWLKAPKGGVYNARDKKTVRDDVAKKIAAGLGLDPLYVMACIKAEKAKSPELRKVWEEIASERAPGPPAPAENGHTSEPLLPHAATACGVCAIGFILC